MDTPLRQPAGADHGVYCAADDVDSTLHFTVAAAVNLAKLSV